MIKLREEKQFRYQTLGGYNKSRALTTAIIDGKAFRRLKRKGQNF